MTSHLFRHLADQFEGTGFDVDHEYNRRYDLTKSLTFRRGDELGERRIFPDLIVVLQASTRAGAIRTLEALARIELGAQGGALLERVTTTRISNAGVAGPYRGRRGGRSSRGTHNYHPHRQGRHRHHYGA